MSSIVVKEMCSSVSAYSILKERWSEMGALRGASAILHWDAATMMPEKSYTVRAKHLSGLGAISTRMMTQSDMPSLLKEAKEDVAKKSVWDQRNVALMEHSYLHSACVDPALLKRMTEASLTTEHLWRECRRDNDFKRFAPAQQEILNLTREMAQQKSSALKLSPYDALLDGYDEGLRSAWITPLFARLKQEMPALIQKASEISAKKQHALPDIHFPIAAQQELGTHMIHTLGFDLEAGRIDTSAHPFCGGIPGDVRMTTRYNESHFLSALMGVMHETGHALYEQGLPEEWRDQPVGDALGMSLHESQSLFVEMQLGRSRAFAEYLTPLVQKTFALDSTTWTVDALYAHMTKVEPSLIRVEADEMTYPMHIVLRFELEQAMLSGDLDIVDLPAAWKKGMKELLGVDVPNDRDGCMQDIHWPEGAFGYFPTYTLGAMTAAQWFDTLAKQIPDAWNQIRRGDFSAIVSWLRKEIHSRACSLPTQTLIETVTGKSLDPEIYMQYLARKYL